MCDKTVKKNITIYQYSIILETIVYCKMKNKKFTQCTVTSSNSSFLNYYREMNLLNGNMSEKVRIQRYKFARMDIIIKISFKTSSGVDVEKTTPMIFFSLNLPNDLF